MAEEMQNENLQQVEDTSSMYLEQIKELKKNSVSRDEYNKILTENRNLLKSLVEGQPMDNQTESEETKVDVNGLRNELFNPDNNMNNLEYVTKALQLRQAIIDQGGADPFLDFGEKAEITPQSAEMANRVADALQDMVDTAAGDPEVFRNEFIRRVR